MNETKKSPWADALGLGYMDSSLNQGGIEDLTDLISVTTADGFKFYPQDQFDVQPDQSLVDGKRILPRKDVIEFWGRVIRPAIEEKIIDEYTAVGWLFSVHPPRVSNANAIANNQRNAEELALRFERWSHKLTQ